MLEKATALKRFEYSPLGKAFEKETDINKKEDKRNKLLKTIVTDKKYRDKVENSLLYLL